VVTVSKWLIFTHTLNTADISLLVKFCFRTILVEVTGQLVGLQEASMNKIKLRTYDRNRVKLIICFN